ncbi:hypothetical protein HOU00_gp274 [Caulobacter phage CcrPW]|uniref:Uncharacterized protein n=1 Tax=Caulobacter phage CcrPW TaxID=2283271 RepID=A0A385EAE5_9CAUD|nr:hypothetical protein HOU00_gp274 [Caulobacter phage CcrPW]AXQ68851.1 hypothetical protein CcrPW_gp312 [Caulobacter phage CcrPW]
MTPIPTDLTCFQLVRIDLASLNPGKGMAQTNHVGTKLVYDSRKWDPMQTAWVETWLEEADGFGTVFTYGATLEQMRTAVILGNAAGCPSKVIADPTYPIRDGESLHFLHLETAAYVFGSRAVILPLMKVLGLVWHP